MTLRDRAAEHSATGDGNSSEVVTAEQHRPRSIAGFIADLRPQIERALPVHLNADRMARLALTEIRTTPKLAACTPQSVAGALLAASALGLEFGKVGEAYLVPYEHKRGPLSGSVECQLQIGYQGFTKLFYQHPLAADIDAQAVYERDDFDFAYGTSKFLRHRPLRDGDRGKVIYFYAVAQLTTGASHFVVLTPDEVRTLRGGKVGPSGQIDDPQLWMERKTAIRQCLKVLPKSTQLAQAIVAEDTTGSELYRVQVETQNGAAQTPGTGQQQLTAAASSASPPEPVDDADAPPPDDDESWDTRKPTTKMKSKIHASLTELNITERDGKLKYYSDVTGRGVSSTNDLTFDEASQVIDILERDLEAAREHDGAS